jgi:hypothetical protein
MWYVGNSANAIRRKRDEMRKSRRIDMLELEIYKLQIELDLIHEIINNVIGTMSAQAEAQRIDSGKWYPRKSQQ